MSFRTYVLKHANTTDDEMFYCDICQKWIDKQRWIHFKEYHRYA